MFLANISLNSPPPTCDICYHTPASLSKINHISQTPTNLQPTTTNQTTVAEPQKFTRLPVGLNLGRNNVIASTFVRGAEDGSQAIDFENWLVSFKDVTQVLGITVKTLEDGKLELRSPGLITRINPQELKTDSELGLVLSIAEIQNKFGVKCEFNLVEYAIVFNPPWLELANADSQPQELPVILEGLPKTKPDNFNFTVIGQQINITGNSNSQAINSQANLKAIGSLFGGSWTLGIEQSDLTDSSSWKLTEFQYLRQTPKTDYVFGSQPTFWQNQSIGAYWGFTTVQRFGFNAQNSLGGAFSPSQRLQSAEIIRTIIGEAKPGTLVQLKAGLSNRVIREVLVDSSGVYRFENIPFGGSGSQNYQVYLYPNGQLTAQPEIQEAKSTILAGQISSGTSALIVSAGLSQQQLKSNFFGSFQDLQGGVIYRRGMTEDLTLGAGIIYDQSWLGLGEFFYQPRGFPLRINANVLMGTKNKGWDYNSNISLNPSPRLNLNFLSDRLSQRFDINWQALTGVSLKLSSNSRENTWIAGINLAQTGRNFSIFTSTDIDNKNNLRWNLSSSFYNFQLSHRGNEIGTNTELNYSLSGNSIIGNSFAFGYETFNSITTDYLATFKWRYRSKSLFREYLPLWEFDLGYGTGSRGNGIIASASTAIIPGLNLVMRYQEISPTSDETSFKIELSPNLNLQPQLSLGDTRFERLRTDGGIFIQPFLDNNGNGKLDQNEQVYLQDAELLVIINNKNLNSYQTDLHSHGVLIKLSPGIYRLDFDPAGYPINRKPLESAYAVEVTAGSYTRVRVPMTLSYTVAGRVTDQAGNPLGGVKVEAVSQSGKSENPIVSITNGAGIFYLEELPIGNYNLLANGQPAQPSSIEIKPDSQPLQEINLVISQ